MFENIPGNNPFKVPDKYFEEVSRKIVSATAGSENEIREARFYTRFRPYILIAASVTGFILISYTALRFFSPTRSESILSEMVADQSEASLLNELDMFSLEESAASITFTEDNSGADAAEIIDYLISENIEISEIYEKL